MNCSTGRGALVPLACQDHDHAILRCQKNGLAVMRLRRSALITSADKAADDKRLQILEHTLIAEEHAHRFYRAAGVGNIIGWSPLKTETLLDGHQSSLLEVFIADIQEDGDRVAREIGDSEIGPAILVPSAHGNRRAGWQRPASRWFQSATRMPLVEVGLTTITGSMSSLIYSDQSRPFKHKAHYNRDNRLECRRRLHTSNPGTTFPCTSVKRKSRPWKR